MRDSDRRPNGDIKKAAFKPRNNGKDSDGLSVSINQAAYLELHRLKYALPGRLTASIKVQSVQGIGLNVRSQPLKDDPAHALITGVPDRPKTDPEIRRQEKLIEDLAKAATLFTFPSTIEEVTKEAMAREPDLGP